jgi:hypothetical protein
MLLHSNAIAENRTAAERAGRIDRQDTHTMIAPAQKTHQLLDERAFPGARRACDSDNARTAAAGSQLLEKSLIA